MLDDLTPEQRRFIEIYVTSLPRDASGGASAGEAADTPVEALPAQDPARVEAQAMASIEAYLSAMDAVNRQISALQTALRSEGDPELDEIADKGLNAITSGFKTKIQAAAMDFRSATGDARKTAAGKLAALAEDFAAFLATDERVEAVDGNPLGVTVSVAGTLGPALQRLQKTMSKAA